MFREKRTLYSVGWTNEDPRAVAIFVVSGYVVLTRSARTGKLKMADSKNAVKWLVERARQSLRHKDPFEAKSWLITAKTLYPADFSIQVSLLRSKPTFMVKSVGRLRYFWNNFNNLFFLIFSMKLMSSRKTPEKLRSQQNSSMKCEASLVNCLLFFLPVIQNWHIYILLCQSACFRQHFWKSQRVENKSHKVLYPLK